MHVDGRLPSHGHDLAVNASLLFWTHTHRLARQLSFGKSAAFSTKAEAQPGRLMLLTWTHVLPGEAIPGVANAKVCRTVSRRSCETALRELASVVDRCL
jgi:hypothetical protein